MCPGKTRSYKGQKKITPLTVAQHVVVADVRRHPVVQPATGRDDAAAMDRVRMRRVLQVPVLPCLIDGAGEEPLRAALGRVQAQGRYRSLVGFEKLVRF